MKKIKVNENEIKMKVKMKKDLISSLLLVYGSSFLVPNFMKKENEWSCSTFSYRNFHMKEKKSTNRHISYNWEAFYLYKVFIQRYTLLSVCNKHQPKQRHEIKVSHFSYLWKKKNFFGKIKTPCYINFKNWYNNCIIIFPKKSFFQELWEMWHFDFMSLLWQMTL